MSNPPNPGNETVPTVITCVDCGGKASLISFLPPDEPVVPGTVLAYRCADCLDRWDLVYEPFETNPEDGN